MACLDTSSEDKHSSATLNGEETSHQRIAMGGATANRPLYAAANILTRMSIEQKR